MKKLSVIGSSIAAVLILILFQNCGRGFTADMQLDATDLGSAIPSTGTSSPDTDPNPSTPTEPTTTLPPKGTINPPKGPQITDGLKDSLMFNKPEGIVVEMSVQNPSGLSFDWIIDGAHDHTTVPRITISHFGRHDVSVVVKDSSGQTSTSRAIYDVSPFSISNGKLTYGEAFTEVSGADVSSLKLLGLNTVADANQLYLFNGTLSLLKVQNASSARVLSPNYVVVDGAVYYKSVVIPNAKGDSFRLLGDTEYGADDAKVFCQSQELTGADPQTIKVPFSGMADFAIDKANLYNGCKKLQSYDASQFEIVKNDFTDPESLDGLLKMSGKYYLVGDRKSLKTTELLALPFISADPGKLKILTDNTPSLGQNGSVRRLVTDGNSFVYLNTGGSEGKNIQTLLKTSFQADVASFKYYSTVVAPAMYLDKDRVYVLHPTGNDATLEILPNAQASTFHYLGSLLYQSGSHIYQINVDGTWKEVTGPDIGQLTSIGDGFFKDSAKVYLLLPPGELQAIDGANPATFKKVVSQLWTDGGKAWFFKNSKILLLDGVDGSSVKVLSGGTTDFDLTFRDNYRVYAAYEDSVTKALQTLEFAVTKASEIQGISSYLYNSTTLYYIKDRKAVEVVGVTPGSPKLLPGCISTATSLVCGGAVVSSLDGTPLVSLGVSLYKDSTSVFWLPKKLDGAKASAFRLANPALSNYYSTDGIHVWYTYTLLPHADPATFKVLSTASAEDKGYTFLGSSEKSKVGTPPPPKTIVDQSN